MNQKHSKEYKSIGQTIKNTVPQRTYAGTIRRIWITSISYLTKIEADLIVTSLFTEVILDISEVLDISVHQLLEDVK